MSVVLNKLNTWNPASHAVLKVWLHQPLPAKPALGDFAGLQTLPDNSSVKSLVDATEKLDPTNPSVQINQTEAALIGSLRSAADRVNRFSPTPGARSCSGGSTSFCRAARASASIICPAKRMDPKSEIFSLMRSNAQVYARFHPLLAQTPLYKSIKLPPTNLYYESFDVEGSAVLGTGAVYQSQVNGGPVNPLPVGVPIISADLEYFLNNGIYVSVELEQLSPVTVMAGGDLGFGATIWFRLQISPITMEQSGWRRA